MGMSATVKDHFDEMDAAIDEKIKLALSAMGEIVEGYAKEDCPVDTGLLRNSITYAVSGQAPKLSSYHASRGSTGASASSVNAGSVGVGRYTGPIGNANEDACYVGSNVEYAPDVEFIDRYHHPVGKAHFLRDGAQNHIQELRETTQKILNTL